MSDYDFRRELVDFRAPRREQLDAELYLDAENADLSGIDERLSFELSLADLELLLFAVGELKGREDLVGRPGTRLVPWLMERLGSEISLRKETA